MNELPEGYIEGYELVKNLNVICKENTFYYLNPERHRVGNPIKLSGYSSTKLSAIKASYPLDLKYVYIKKFVPPPQIFPDKRGFPHGY